MERRHGSEITLALNLSHDASLQDTEMSIFFLKEAKKILKWNTKIMSPQGAYAKNMQMEHVLYMGKKSIT